MSTTPPLLTEETYARVVRVARFDGLSILGAAGFFALLAAASKDVGGAVLGLVVAGGGALELHGVNLLRHGYARGMDWLIRSQFFLLIVLLGYCAMRLTHVDLTPLRPAFQRALSMPIMQEMWATNQALGVTEEQMLTQVYTLTYFSLALATLVYQGGMSLYYVRRRAAVERALAEE